MIALPGRSARCSRTEWDELPVGPSALTQPIELHALHPGELTDQRFEANAERAEQEQRVEVGRATAQTPVQAAVDNAARVAGVEQAERAADADDVSDVDSPADRLVRRAEAARVIDAHHAAARHCAHERHHARAGREHRLAHGASEVHPAVAGQPWPRGRVEGPHHRRRARQWPRPSRSPDCAGGRGRQDEQGEAKACGNRRHGPRLRAAVTGHETPSKICGQRRCLWTTGWAVVAGHSRMDHGQRPWPRSAVRRR